jgi:hypothetical protein
MHTILVDGEETCSIATMGEKDYIRRLEKAKALAVKITWAGIHH